jgi:hypothetical protein
MNPALLPVIFLRFWFLEGPLRLLNYFGQVNRAFFELFSLPLLLRTFFRPLKNEYREGLVGFSIGVGIVVKSVLIVFNFLLLIPLLVAEVVILVVIVTLPITTILLLFR